MLWLNVPHLKQNKTGWCLPACVAMVAAYWQQPLVQEDVARWLGATNIGVPASHIQRMTERGFQITYRIGSLHDTQTWLQQGVPCILFVRTGDLSYWKIDTPHAVVLAGIESDRAFLFDPAMDTAPNDVPINELMLAWSHFDYTFAVLRV